MPNAKYHSMVQLWLDRLKKFRHFLGPETWTLFSAAVVIGVFWFLVEASFAYILQGFLSTLGLVNLPGDSWLAKLYPRDVSKAVLVLLTFGILRMLSIFLRLYFSNITHQTFIRHQRSHILSHALYHAETESTPEIINLFSTRVDESAKVIQYVVALLNMTTAFVLFSAFAFWVAPLEFIIAFGILGIALLPLRRFNASVNAVSHGLVDESRKVTRSILLGLRNNFLLRVYGAIDKVIQDCGKALKLYESHYRTYSLAYALNVATPHLVGVFAISVVTYISLRYLHTPGPSLLVFFYLFFRIAQTASDANSHISELKVLFPSAKVLYQFNLRTAETARKERHHLRNTDPIREIGELRLENVSFAWSPERPLFKGLNMRVHKGDLLLIKGESGSGKSTLLALICGMLQPHSGHVLMDNKPISELDFNQVSALIGYVGPDSYIIEGTIRENLLFGHLNPLTVHESDLLFALEQASLSADLKQWPQGLETMLNEFTQLSTGQKQRLSFARALVRRPQLLILDEATANLDPETETHLIESIKNIRADLITITISHRDSFDTLATKKINLHSFGYNERAV